MYVVVVVVCVVWWCARESVCVHACVRVRARMNGVSLVHRPACGVVVCVCVCVCAGEGEREREWEREYECRHVGFVCRV